MSDESDVGEEITEPRTTEAEGDEKLPDNPLIQDVIPECLSLLCKIGSGLTHAYVRLDVHDRDITDIQLLKSFIHVRYVDLSGNFLRDITPLNHLTNMLTLKADKNQLTSPKLEALPFLQIANFANNKITSTEGVEHPLLEQLNLNSNQITSISGLHPGTLTNLHTLELRGNKLESTAGIYLPNLKNLYLAANIIKSIEGLERLEKLTLLHLRDNQISTLDGFSDQMKSLQYINLRGNNITSLKELNKLVSLPLLRAIVLNDNPCQEEDSYRVEVLIYLRRLERLDKDEYSGEERTEAEDIHEQRRQEELLLKGEEGGEEEGEAAAED
ncbi:leucine-rich repeat-containing protein 23-like [Styela clava]